MLRERSLLALTTAEFVSTLGSQFSALALPWFVLATTHSCVGLGAPFWLLVPQVPLAVMITAMAIIGFANPMANAPIFGILTTRVPRAVFPQVVQTIIVSNQVVRPAAYATAGVLFASIGLHTVYAIAAVLATVASTNFILAILAENPSLAQEAA